MNKATCRGCGARIVWIKTPAREGYAVRPVAGLLQGRPRRERQDRHDPRGGRRLPPSPRELTPPTPGTATLGHLPAGRPLQERGPAAVDEVGIFQKIRELFDEAPKRMCDEPAAPSWRESWKKG